MSARPIVLAAVLGLGCGTGPGAAPPPSARAPLAAAPAVGSAGAPVTAPPPSGGGSSLAPIEAPPAPVPEGPALAACVLPPDELHGYLVARDADVVLSTSAGELRPIAGSALDAALASRRLSGDASMPWLVLGAPGVAAGAVRALGARAQAAGLTDVRECEAAAGSGWAVEGDGSVRAPVAEAAGDLGLTGFGSGGGPVRGGGGGDDLPTYGSGSGGFGRRAAAPRVRLPEPTVLGSMSRDIVRRVVRRHVAELRYCYERELAASPELTGSVELAWVVSATGATAEARVVSSTLARPAVEACLTAAVGRWTFPAPEGEVVRVTQAIAFAPPE